MDMVLPLTTSISIVSVKIKTTSLMEASNFPMLKRIGDFSTISKDGQAIQSKLDMVQSIIGIGKVKYVS